ncbi:hypothetical protein EVG20_g10312 [Dentipellis fragilis]|uniref:Uncharacterized protein n=1 Tax=Dentipellis fragilis TaxID=205917 RepID=A0A4Y9XWN4_9AGAM|nr:hypothetical protein EVG20_g10312 [Dentipellis fragilis]
MGPKPAESRRHERRATFRSYGHRINLEDERGYQNDDAEVQTQSDFRLLELEAAALGPVRGSLSPDSFPYDLHSRTASGDELVFCLAGSPPPSAPGVFSNPGTLDSGVSLTIASLRLTSRILRLLKIYAVMYTLGRGVAEVYLPSGIDAVVPRTELKLRVMPYK